MLNAIALSYDSLDIIYPSGRVAIPCTIKCNGQSYPVNLLYNASVGQRVVLHSEFLKELGLEEGDSLVFKFNDSVELEVKDRMSMDLANITMLAKRDSLVNKMDRPFIGIIGPGVFDCYDIIELDIAGRKLNLLDEYEVQPDSIKMKFQVQDDIAYVNFEPVRDYKLKAMVNTNFYETSIDRSCAMVAGVDNADFPSCWLDGIDIVPYTAIKPEENLSYYYSGFDGVIGNSFWQNFKMIVDYRENIIILDEIAAAEKDLYNKEYYNALLLEDYNSILKYLENNPESKIADDAALYLLKYIVSGTDFDIDTAYRVCDCIFSVYSAKNASHIILQYINSSSDGDLYKRILQILKYVKDKLSATGTYNDTAMAIDARIAELMLDHEQVEAGYEYLLAAVFRDPENPEINYQLGRYYQSKGRIVRAWYRYFKAATGRNFSIDAVKKLCELHNLESFRSEYDIEDSAELFRSTQVAFYPALGEMNWNEGGFGLLEFFIFTDNNELEQLQSAIDIIKRYNNRSKFNAICYYVDNPEISPLASKYSNEILERYRGYGRPSIYVNGKSYGFSNKELKDPVAIIQNLYEIKNIRSVEKCALNAICHDGICQMELLVPIELVGSNYEVVLVENNVLYYDKELKFLDHICRGLVCKGEVKSQKIKKIISLDEFRNIFTESRVLNNSVSGAGVNWVSKYIDLRQCSLIIKFFDNEGNVTGISKCCLKETGI